MDKVCSFSSHNGFPGDESPEFSSPAQTFDTQNEEKIFRHFVNPRSTRVVSWRIGHPSDWLPFPFSDPWLGNIIKSHLAWIRVNKFSPDSICFSSIYYYEFLLLLLFLYEFFRQSLRLPVLVICFVDVNFHNFYKYRSASRRDEAFIESKDFIAITRSKTFPTSFSDPLIALLTPSLTLSSSEKKKKKGSNSLEINYTDQMIGILLLYLLFHWIT